MIQQKYNPGDHVVVVKVPHYADGTPCTHQRWTPPQQGVIRSTCGNWDYLVTIDIDGTCWGINEDELESPFVQACREALEAE